jgi:hypothetical protein
MTTLKYYEKKKLCPPPMVWLYFKPFFKNFIEKGQGNPRIYTGEELPLSPNRIEITKVFKFISLSII